MNISHGDYCKQVAKATPPSARLSEGRYISHLFCKSFRIDTSYSFFCKNIPLDITTTIISITSGTLLTCPQEGEYPSVADGAPSK